MDRQLRSWHSMRDYGSVEKLRKDVAAKDRLLEGARSLAWRVLLLFDTLDDRQWSAELESSRGAYESLRNQFLTALQHPEEDLEDPLSEGANSTWDNLRKDEALRQEIFQDVDRCMPDNLYFKQPATQTMLDDVLFVWAKLNPDVSYRQGMHELAATVLWVVERDAVDVASSGNKSFDGDDGLVCRLFDSRYIAHDTFNLFAAIMRVQRAAFDHISSGDEKKPSQQSMTDRCKNIVEVPLARVDPALSKHLLELEVTPQIFLMRWIRLLFGREFAFDHTLLLWDKLFATGISSELIDATCIVMMLRIRWQLLEADYNNAIQLLMRYPEPATGTDVANLANYASHLRLNTDFDGGSHVVRKQTGRALPETERPSTPTLPVDLETPRPASRQMTPLRKSGRLVQGPQGLETLFGDAARGIYARGEKSGLNQAVRGVVGEVRKNVQQIQSRSHSRMQSRDDFTGTSTNDALLQRINVLEERNKALAKMLQGAVTTLFEGQTATATNSNDSQGMTEAVAKVQFVQVFLEDSSLALPLIEEEPAEAGSSGPTTATRPERSADQVSRDKSPQAQSLQRDASFSLTATKPGQSEPSPADATTASSPQKTEDKARQPATERPKKTSRPPLEQSSFSWMLGQQDTSPGSARQAFASASTFKEGSVRKKSSARASNAYLFGESDEDPLARRGSPVKSKDRPKEEDKKDDAFRLGTLKGKPS